MESLEIRTRQRTEFVEITDRVNALLRQSSIQEGICVV